MTLLTVMGADRGKKIMIFAETVGEVIAEACRKLALPHLQPEQYRVVLANSGAILDEDKFIPLLSAATELMILAVDEDWLSEGELRGRREISNDVNCSRRIVDGNQFSRYSPALLTRSPSVSERRAPLSFPWEKLTDNIKEKLDLHVPLPDERKLELRKIICMHLTGTLKDYTRTTTNAVVNLLLNKYPEALVIKDADGDILNNGAKAFCIKLYDQVQYKKPASQKISRKRPPSSAENDENEEGNSSNSSSFHTSIRSVRHRDFDEYGTVAYEPPLPDGETKLSQESKLMRLRLLHSKRDKNDDDEIKQLLSETYATQRKDIIDRVGTLNEFLKNWPHLEDAEHFLNHASVLFDRDMKEVWDEKLAAKGAALFSIFEKECEKSNQVCVARREARRKMKEAVIEANEASENLTTQTPKYLSLFKLLPLYFLEEDNKMYHIVSDLTLETEIQNVGNTARPVLIIKGNSLHDATATSSVYAQGEEIVKARNISEGFLCYFLAHYVYAFDYGVNFKSLEFIQRVFQKINPPKVHKRGRNAKRNHHIVNPQVQKLMDRIGIESSID